MTITVLFVFQYFEWAFYYLLSYLRVAAAPKGTGEKMLESWESFMQPETRPVMLDRWDWHLWQLFTALLPGFGKCWAPWQRAGVLLCLYGSGHRRHFRPGCLG